MGSTRSDHCLTHTRRSSTLGLQHVFFRTPALPELRLPADSIEQTCSSSLSVIGGVVLSSSEVWCPFVWERIADHRPHCKGSGQNFSRNLVFDRHEKPVHNPLSTHTQGSLPIVDPTFPHPQRSPKSKVRTPFAEAGERSSWLVSNARSVSDRPLFVRGLEVQPATRVDPVLGRTGREMQHLSGRQCSWPRSRVCRWRRLGLIGGLFERAIRVERWCVGWRAWV